MAGLKFEDSLNRLEKIVQSLEKGDLPLEESLRMFEEGVKLSKSCLKLLEEAERKVEILLADKDGKKRPQPFTPDEGESE
jgi:exodeoxyribonuclease VII small subunit